MKTSINKKSKETALIQQASKSTIDRTTTAFRDNRPETVAQRKLQEKANRSQQQSKATQLQAKIKQASTTSIPIQQKKNNTGLPNQLKSGIENLSGHSMDDVKVHYNSSKPAQLNAHAYAQGSNIHLGSGQEKHLPHEAWHVAQQKQGRVKPTTQMKGVNVNDNAGLEREADVMGAKANSTIQRKQDLTSKSVGTAVVQRAPSPIDMHADVGDLKASYIRKKLVDNIYQYMVSNAKFSHEANTEARALTYLKNTYAGPGKNKLKALGDAEKLAIAKELMGRNYHDKTAAEEISPSMRGKLGSGRALSEDEEDTVGPDIEASTVKEPKKGIHGSAYEIDSKLTTAKACVITALMFAQKGGVFGAKSIEELHFILSTRFKTTWRHYSEDKVYKSLYESLDYTKAAPATQNKKLSNLANMIGNKTHGMVSIAGHMIGFQVDDGKVYVRDNDEGMKERPDQHSKKNSNVTEIWTK